MLPETLRDRRMSVFLTGPDEMLIDAHEQDEEYWSGGPIVRLFWINSHGHVERNREVRLAGSVPTSQRSAARNFALLAPVSIVWILGLLIGGPIALLHANKASHYAAALAYAANLAWAPMVVVLLVSASACMADAKTTSKVPAIQQRHVDGICIPLRGARILSVSDRAPATETGIMSAMRRDRAAGSRRLRSLQCAVCAAGACGHRNLRVER